MPLETELPSKSFVKTEVPVLRIEHDGKPELCHMQPDLMHAPGFDLDPQQRGLREPPDNSESSQCGHLASFPPRKWKIDRTMILRNAPGDETQVFFFDLAGFE